VEKNRAAGPFVVDDGTELVKCEQMIRILISSSDGMGYDDMGEADLFGGEEEEYDDEVGKPNKCK